MEIPRTRPSEHGTERETLVGLLDFLRATVARKVVGLTEEQARSRPVPASSLTPLGIVKHLTGVERFWFSIDFADSGEPWPWPEGGDGAFSLTAEDTVDGLVGAYLAQCARSNEITAAAGLEDNSRGPDVDFTLRYALAHMVEETARHCGHLDLMRESIDGARGQ